MVSILSSSALYKCNETEFSDPKINPKRNLLNSLIKLDLAGFKTPTVSNKFLKILDQLQNIFKLKNICDVIEYNGCCSECYIKA